MSIGNKPVYPFEDNRAEYTHEGLTYREWLIGMLASNQGMLCLLREDSNFIDEVATANNLVLQADAIIKQLDKESK